MNVKLTTFLFLCVLCSFAGLGIQKGNRQEAIGKELFHEKHKTYNV